ncbi:RagB/SusD family nutrient uptake outer membrane protein [Zunongwangia sp. F363]|uniref:RagB/SusD family nutrient uptake outer membrane protein n=1 Tax=Autumnicola tepida TaxID=3075595 RepID=A0ABU3C7A3_9FLAO|nr:RagB/SusD family nutrient uptake outer membrane protein [Zunongwangia sp. F363]MDT0642179.1 RagB/SusD family nutrient uptake outer membrane protein [Zunongwangia sp. F363]
MKKHSIISGISILAVCVLMLSCEDFVEVEVPDYKLTKEAVYANDQTAQSVLNGIYNQLFNTSFANGGSQSVTFLGGLSADNFKVTTTTQQIVEYYQNQITPTNSYNLTLWAGAYNTIYMVNAMLEGIANNSLLSRDLINRMEGNGKFIRAFTYFYLVNLYGDVPLLLGTNYQNNAAASRTSAEIVYNQILEDLEDAETLLEEDYPDNDRTRPNKFAVLSLLARVHLFLGNWEEAAFYSSQVIAATEYYALLNPDEVFLANSGEAIWQISPVGWGNSFTHTREGNLFIKNPTSNTPVVLSSGFLNSFDNAEDKRRLNWVNNFVDEEDTLYYPYKYKIQYDASGGLISEYSMVLRLAEQYLIRAEARTRLGKFAEAVEDINVIRSRAGIPLIEGSQSTEESELLEILLQERRRELFAEWGHRWFDLQRFDKSEILANKDNSNWAQTSGLFPIPSTERMKDPNLTQNQGY